MKPEKNFPLYAQVYVDIKNSALNKPFSYGVPEEMADKIYIGASVKVPFGNRSVLGFAVELSEFPPIISNKIKIKPIDEIVNSDSLWDSEMLELAKWLENYYLSSFVASMNVLVPYPVRPSKDGTTKNTAKIKKAVLLKNPGIELEKISKKAPSQAKILEYLINGSGEEKVSVLAEAVGGRSAVSALSKKGYIKIIDDLPELKIFRNYQAEKVPHFPLTEAQKKVYDELYRLYKNNKAEVALLHGITGSGKTEIYLQIIDQALKDGRDALVLVPEISLTPQAVERFMGRFGENIAVLHSRLTDAERRRMWRKIRDHEVRVVLGARSAVFAPLENIGVIVVDEEHESSYKQEREPRYHARQVAIKRAFTHKSLVILGSATPSLEVYHRAKEGKYHYLELSERIGHSVLPEVQIVNLKEDRSDKSDKEKNYGIIGDTLKGEIERVLGNGEQAILFLNRRGFSAFLLCLECGNVIRCPYCDITLTYHKVGRILKCHYCDYHREAPNLCPICGGIKLTTPSYGIQKVEEEIREYFPGTGIIRMDRDTTSGRDAHQNLLGQFAARKASILLGTQMIAKGLDFPGVTLVGVVFADVSLNLPDFRSLERSYQVLTQVAGRAGRRESPGKVVIQTYNPDYPVIQAVARQDYDEFFRWESGNRKELNYPPFSHIINIIFTGENSDKIREYASFAADLFGHKRFKVSFISVLGPAPCCISRIKSRHRWHITLKGANIPKMNSIVKAVLEKYPPPSGVGVAVDVDPVNLL